MKKIVGFFVCLLCLGFVGAAVFVKRTASVAQTRAPETVPQKNRITSKQENAAVSAQNAAKTKLPDTPEIQKIRAAAERGDADAQFKLGSLFQFYNGLLDKQAIAWYRKAGDQGNLDAQLKLAWMLRWDEKEEAAEWERKASDTRKKIFMETRLVAEQGNADAQFKLGESYRRGLGVAADDEQAIVWYRKAAEQGHLVAQWALGTQSASVETAKWRGKAASNPRWTHEISSDEAVKWMHKAAEGGYAEAQYDLGVMYRDGNGVAKDAAQAIEWFRKAAEQGNSDAAYDLGNMYRDGKDIAQDDVQAVAWYRKAVVAVDMEDNYPGEIQEALGDMYVQGRGIAPSREQAIAWVRKAASEGDGVAQYALGEMYLHGNGVKADQDQAFFWLQKAVNDNQNDPAAEALECFGQSPNCLEYEGDEDDGD